MGLINCFLIMLLLASSNSSSIPYVKQFYPGTVRWDSSSWYLGSNREIPFKGRDSFDPLKFSTLRGTGHYFIRGDGRATLTGTAPRMYLYTDPLQEFLNTESTVYFKSITAPNPPSYAGMDMSLRNDHYHGDDTCPCDGNGYHGRMTFDGRIQFLKEASHGTCYINAPGQETKGYWLNNKLPSLTWIGLKMVTYTLSNNSVMLELYRDLTEAQNGGSWELIRQTVDSGTYWGTPDCDLQVQACPTPNTSPTNCVYKPSSSYQQRTKPGHSIYVRTDDNLGAEMDFKWFIVRDITNGQDKCTSFCNSVCDLI